jgi:lipoate-protein ligase A
MELLEVKSMRESTYKVPDGKLLKVKLQVVSDNIAEVKILGDFFLHPEDTILKIEEALIGLPYDQTSVTKTIDVILKESGATLVGATAADIATTIMMAWDSV